MSQAHGPHGLCRRTEKLAAGKVLTVRETAGVAGHLHHFIYRAHSRPGAAGGQGQLTPTEGRTPGPLLSSFCLWGEEYLHHTDYSGSFLGVYV